MTLQERIISLSEYSLSFETCDGNFVVAIAYNPKWKVKKPDNEKINFIVNREMAGVCYYEIPITENIDEIFNCIDEVIAFNKELELKIALYSEKKEELKNLFRNESLATLKTLEFKVKKKKEKNKDSSYTEVIDTAAKIEENVDKNGDNAESEVLSEKPKPKEIVIDQNIENKISAAIKNKNK